MLRSSAARRGAGNPMTIAVIALVIAVIGLFLALFRDQMKPGFGLGNPFGDGLGGYDFDSPAAALKSEMEIERRRDIRAMLALQQKVKDKETQEHIDTLKVDEEVDYKKKDKDKSSDYKILFTSYKQKGENKKRVVTMEKDADSGIWHRSYLSPFDVEKDNKELGQKMQNWDRPEMAIPRFPS